MKLEHYSEKKLKKEILEIIGKRLDFKKYKVFFFGSRVKGNNFPRADIDIGIEGPKETPDGVVSDIKEELDKLSTLYKFDVVDFKTVSEKFKKEAKKKIEYVK
jgi:predicted nucleotidyltransferase